MRAHPYILSLLVLILCGSASAQQQVPAESMNKLVDVFTAVRDGLWESNEDYWHRGYLDRCIACMRMITQIDPKDTEAYINTAWLMYSDARDEDAEAFLREGFANNTDTYDMYQELGTFVYMRMRFDESIRYLAGAVMQDPPPFVWHQLAHAYERAGRIGDCLDTWFEIQAMEPEDSVAPMQIDRILHGGEPSREPEIIVNAIATRKQEKAEQQHQQAN